jgi:hypothetical protein
MAPNVVKKLTNPSHQENASPIGMPNVKADPKIIAKSETLNESQKRSMSETSSYPCPSSLLFFSA